MDSKVKVLSEPEGRNTAPCVYWAAKEIQKVDPNAVMVVVPSDHSMADVPAFKKTLADACEYANKNKALVTLGVNPDRPETGYGYLETGEKLEGSCVRVSRFVEKPNLENAKKFLEAGNFLWNGGMFVWKIETVLAAYEGFLPSYDEVWKSSHENFAKLYAKFDAVSIDVGIMEKAENVVTFPLSCGWNDLGNWSSLDQFAEECGKTQAAGAMIAGDVIAIDSKENIVDVPGKLVALLGVDNLVVVDTGKAILIAKKDRSQDVRDIVQQVKISHPDLV